MYSISYVAADALLVHFDEEDIDQCASQVAALREFLFTHFREQCVDIVPAYRSLTVFVRFPHIYPQSLNDAIRSFLDSTSIASQSNAETHTINLPCCYDPEFGLDIETLARDKNLTTEELVHIHSSKRYRVYAIGFSPGFPYLGFVDDRIASPRLSSPRTHVPWGSVGIADQQTGIYPSASPGGWNIVGRCPTPLFQPQALHSEDLCVLDVGDCVRFQAIEKSEFLEQLKAQQTRD